MGAFSRLLVRVGETRHDVWIRVRREADTGDMRRFRPSVFLLLGGLSLASCSAPGVRGHVGYGLYTLDGNLGVSSDATSPQSVDLRDDLGLNGFSDSLQVRAELDAGPVRLTGSAFRFHSSGDGTLTADFGDVVVGGPTLSRPVSSNIDVMNAKIALTADVVDLGMIRVSPGIALDIIDVDGRVSDFGTSLSESFGETLPIPMPFVQAEASFFGFDLVAEIGGIAADFDEFDGSLIDFETFLTYEPIDSVELYVGYRLIHLEGDGVVDSQAYDSDLRLQGVFFGAGFEL